MWVLATSGKIEKNLESQGKNWSLSFLAHKSCQILAIQLFLVTLLLENFSILNFLLQCPFSLLVDFSFWDFLSLTLSAVNFKFFCNNYVLASDVCPEKVRELLYMKNMFGMNYTGTNVDTDHFLYLLCFYRLMLWSHSSCGQVFLKKWPSDKYLFSM